MLKWCELKADVDYKNLNYKPVELSKCKSVRTSIQTEEFISVHGIAMRGRLQDVFFDTIERKSDLDDNSNCMDLAYFDSIVKGDNFEAWVMLETDESTVYFFCTVITCGGGELQLRIAETNHKDLLSVNVVKK